jgi:flagellar hook-basal body complex protein FliE
MIVRGIIGTPSTEAAPGIEGLAPPTTPAPISEAAGPTFEGVLSGMLAQASEQHHVAAAQSEAVSRGTLDDLHGTMIAVKEAEISLKLVGSVRNRLIEAFQEIWRTNV